MLKIFTSYNKQDIIYSYSTGQAFPDIKGKLLRIEISGNELMVLNQKKEIPIHAIDTSCLIWYEKNAGHILKLLREILVIKK
jgi:hypothetical protein